MRKKEAGAEEAAHSHSLCAAALTCHLPLALIIWPYSQVLRGPRSSSLLHLP